MGTGGVRGHERENRKQFRNSGGSSDGSSGGKQHGSVVGRESRALLVGRARVEKPDCGMKVGR